MSSSSPSSSSSSSQPSRFSSLSFSAPPSSRPSSPSLPFSRPSTPSLPGSFSTLDSSSLPLHPADLSDADCSFLIDHLSAEAQPSSVDISEGNSSRFISHFSTRVSAIAAVLVLIVGVVGGFAVRTVWMGSQESSSGVSMASLTDPEHSAARSALSGARDFSGLDGDVSACLSTVGLAHSPVLGAAPIQRPAPDDEIASTSTHPKAQLLVIGDPLRIAVINSPCTDPSSLATLVPVGGEP